MASSHHKGMMFLTLSTDGKAVWQMFLKWLSVCLLDWLVVTFFSFMIGYLRRSPVLFDIVKPRHCNYVSWLPVAC